MPISPSVTARLQDYRRYARTLSSMSKPDALRAVEIGMQNLAATADYPDPLRLEWTMEADSVRDLASGSVTVEKGTWRSRWRSTNASSRSLP